jgi:hypothetical protein
MRRHAALADDAPNEARTKPTPGDDRGDRNGRAGCRPAPLRSRVARAFPVAVRVVVPATLLPLADAPARRRRPGPDRAAALLETLDA